MKRYKVGNCGVDSGQLFIIDPGYLTTWQPGDPQSDHENSYVRVAEFMLENGHGEVEAGVVVALDADGEYPVYVIEDDEGYLLKIEIDLHVGGEQLRRLLGS